MALTSRISFLGPEPSEPEDYLSSALGVIFPDDVTNQHGGDGHSLVYLSPHLPRPLQLDLAEAVSEQDRYLFSHFLWNSSLLLAELVESSSLGLAGSPKGKGRNLAAAVSFDVKGLDVLELGAGTGLASIMAGLLGANRVAATDYPSPIVLKALETNVTRNIKPDLSPSPAFVAPSIAVEGHAWGSVDDPFSRANQHAFDRLLVADCLWMPQQHANLRRSIGHFLKTTPAARCWVIGGFHTGREKMATFFRTEPLRADGLEVESMWERECDGLERAWAWERDEDISVRKRWLVIAVLRRTESAMKTGGAIVSRDASGDTVTRNA